VCRTLHVLVLDLFEKGPILDWLSEECVVFHAERYTMRMINTINKYLYGRLGYKGATNYLDPDNSCINMVLKRREGMAMQSYA
jgi:hypothetical protein